MIDANSKYWSLEPEELMRRLGSSRDGLPSAAAAARLREYGSNELREGRRLSHLRVLVSLLAALAAITVLYVVATEALKRWFYRGAT